MRLKLSAGDADTVTELERTIAQGVTMLYNMTTGSRTAAEVVSATNGAIEQLKEFTEGLAQMLDINGPARIERDPLDHKHYLVWGE